MASKFTLLARSGLARRTFVVVATAVAAVVLGVLWFTMRWSGQYLDAQVRRDTSAAAKQYGLGVFQRLDLAALALAHAPAFGSGSSVAMSPVLSTYFDSIEATTRLAGHALDDTSPGARRLSGMRAGSDANGLPYVELIDRRPAGTLIGRVSAAYLWNPESFPVSHRITVVDSNGLLLFRHPAAGAGASASPPAASRTAATWPLFLRERFGAGDWQFRLQAGSAETNASFVEFRRTLLQSLLPLLAGLGLLASVLIRRSHRPLEQLIDATRRVADGDFAVRVATAGDPDSRALIGAFNDMTDRIAHQWRAMQLLSRLDQSILEAPDFDRTTQLVLQESAGIIRFDTIAVMLLRDSNQSLGDVLCMASDAPDAISRNTVHIPPYLLSRLREGGTIAVAREDTCGDWLADVMRNTSLRAFRLVPIRQGSTPRGALLLGQLADTTISAESQQDERLLAERIAVALTSADRDAALLHNAHYDDLTQLPNRRFFSKRLAEEVSRSASAGSQLALLFMDLDRFKLVNDAAGHNAGDRLLQMVAQRLATRLQDGEFVARPAGDEFTIILPGSGDPAHIAARATSFIEALCEPVVVDDQEHVVTTSVGIAIYPRDGEDAESLLRNADAAMYRAKADGQLRFAFYETRMNAGAAERMRLERDLRKALVRDELLVHFQPQIDLRTGAVVGAEGLLRWQHPELGLLGPDRFLQIAEESGLILPIGEWVLDTACAQYRRWHNEGIRLDRIAVNASIRQLMSPQFARRVHEAMQVHTMPRGVLEIEITETALARELDYMEALLSELRAMGLSIAIDDFGIGYSSLSYLQRLPIDILKIDRSFMPHPQLTGGSGTLCETIIAMGKALHKHVIAEGVETQLQAEFLRHHGCQLAQGYYFAMAMPAAAFTAFCRSRSPLASLAV